MADWKIPVSYNYSPSYHAYAYGLMYPHPHPHPHGPEQSHPAISWPEAAYGAPAGGAGAGPFYPTSSSAPQTASSQTPPGSPDCGGVGGSPYPCTSLLYYAESQAAHAQNARLFVAHHHHHRVQLEPRDRGQERGGSSDTPSDSEAHTPDSWSSGSSREGNPAPLDLDVPERLYVQDAGGLMPGLLPGLSEAPVREKEEVEDTLPTVVPSPPKSETTPAPRKPKARTAFSEGQMNALNDRFNVQRYLTPAEMKTLAGLTGLTYKQVKTWFQNRRMKLKRNQKDNTWVSEHYVGPGVSSAPATPSQFQLDPAIVPPDFYNHPQFRGTVFKKSPPHTPSFYPGYHRPASPPSITSRTQGNWPLPPAVTHYEFPHPSSYMAASGTTDGMDSPKHLTMLHSASQWST